MAGLNKEIWLDFLAENFYSPTDWIEEVVDFSAFVENNTLNLAEMGVDPTVYVDFDLSGGDIPVADRADNPYTIPLQTYDTENARIKKVEMYELAYDKMASTVTQHKKALKQKTIVSAAYNYAPANDMNATGFLPLISSSGAAEGLFNRIQFEDIYRLDEEYDMVDLPQEGRILVLHPTHRRQLRAQDLALFKSIFMSGDAKPKIGNFTVYPFPYTAKYTEAVPGGPLVKTAFGSAPADTDRISSLSFINSEVCKADGTYDMFLREMDPYKRGNVVGFQKRFKALPIRYKGQGGIVSRQA